MFNREHISELLSKLFVDESTVNMWLFVTMRYFYPSICSPSEGEVFERLIVSPFIHLFIYVGLCLSIIGYSNVRILIQFSNMCIRLISFFYFTSLWTRLI